MEMIAYSLMYTTSNLIVSSETVARNEVNLVNKFNSSVCTMLIMYQNLIHCHSDQYCGQYSILKLVLNDPILAISSCDNGIILISVTTDSNWWTDATIVFVMRTSKPLNQYVCLCLTPN